jgi:2-oxoglutarate/2-oxoacid ferredoxin oxidoreductase subunit alpha
LYNFEKTENIYDLLEKGKARGLVIISLPTRSRLEGKHWSLIMENTILIGAMAKILQIPFAMVEEVMSKKYGKKASLLEKNIACLQYGFDAIGDEYIYGVGTGSRPVQERLLIDGNTAIALGAIQAGVSCYFAYPMSPSSSILTVMAETAEQSGVLVRQVEDEITAAQMTL